MFNLDVGDMDSSFLAGRLLIAMPGIGDPRFERAVVLVWAHDAEHALGIAVNRPVEGLTLAELFEKLDIPSVAPPRADAVLIGGPVETERGFVLHTDDFQGPHSVEAGEGLLLTATREVLQAMAMHEASPRKAMLALGYAGWGAGQLEAELRENVWLTSEADEALIFDDDHETKWARALAKIGVDAERLSHVAGRA